MHQPGHLFRTGRRVAHLRGARTRCRGQRRLRDQLHLVVAGSTTAGTVDRQQAVEPQQCEAGGVRLSDSDGTVSFQCSLDGAAYGPCTSLFTTAALADGSHTFAVEAVDISNRTSNPTQYTWTIDTVAPPAPSITSKPAAVVASGSASFGFTDTEAGVAFECQVDGAAFASCTSPATYSGLATGQHTFAVRARDAAGNAGAATSYSWRVDITPPAQPTGLTAGLTSQAVNLTWNANTETDLAGYNVYRSASATGPFTKLNSALLTTRGIGHDGAGGHDLVLPGAGRRPARKRLDPGPALDQARDRLAQRHERPGDVRHLDHADEAERHGQRRRAGRVGRYRPGPPP